MTPVGRLVCFFLLTGAVAVVALWATRETLQSRESLQESGMRWLRHEYRLDDAAFQRISSLHSDYFQQCDQMCRQIDEASRPFFWRARQRHRSSSSNLDTQFSKEQALCTDCEKAAVEHLHQVAKLMTPDQGKRFLEDILPLLQQQRREHDLRVSSSIRR